MSKEHQKITELLQIISTMRNTIIPHVIETAPTDEAIRALESYIKDKDINKQFDGRSDTPLRLCAQFSKLPIIEFLLNNGANINQQDKYGLTPFNWACMADRDHADMDKVVKYLIAHGANPDLVPSEDLICYKRAEQYLKDHPVDKTPLSAFELNLTIDTDDCTPPLGENH